jgi:hypothetical protein
LERITAGLIKSILCIAEPGRRELLYDFRPTAFDCSCGRDPCRVEKCTKGKVWLATTALIAIGLTVVLNFYLAPLVQSMFQHSAVDDLPTFEIVAGVEQWKLGNRIRLIVELFGLVCSIISLRIWSSEIASHTERAD